MRRSGLLMMSKVWPCSRIPRPIHLPHTARSQGRQHLVGTQVRADANGHDESAPSRSAPVSVDSGTAKMRIVRATDPTLSLSPSESGTAASTLFA